METSAPKRRKTSPTTNVPVDDPSAPAPASESPDGSVRRSSRRRRPSFASPTKASLARSNPEILARRNLNRARWSSNNALPASELASQANEPESDSERANAQLEAESEAGRDGGRSVERDNEPSSQSKSPLRRVIGSMASKPRRTPNRPSPRPLPPPPEEEEELIDPFRGSRRLRRSPAPGIFPAMEPEEPELPPTPTQKGLVDRSALDTSPLRSHNTPSKKRPRRSKIFAETMKKSSPLKQPPLRPPETVQEAQEDPTPSRELSHSPESASKNGRSRRRKLHPSRNIKDPDPLDDKKALRDSLLAEVIKLKGELRLISHENDRLYQQHTRQSPSEIPGPVEEASLLVILRRHALPIEKETPPDALHDWLEAAVNPIAFLPFGKVDSILPHLLNLQGVPDATDKLAPTSHHPISMSTEEELPYLQVFTPLTFTSTISAIPREDAERESPSPLLQKHIISASSTPPGLFTAKIDMVVNSKTLAISELAVPRLDPSAVKELGPFIKEVTQADGRGTGNSAVTRNVSVITWAMSEWVRLATKRARFWCAVERELGNEEELLRCARKMRKGARRKGPGRRAMEETDGDDIESLERGPKESDADTDGFRKGDVLSQLGRTSIDLELSSPATLEEAPTVRVEWTIGFDWTGEGQSKIGLLLGAPTRWHGHDTKKSLTHIPDMFDKLLQESKDPMEALRTVVALVIGDPRNG